MVFFLDILVLFILIGVVTQTILYFAKKKWEEKTAIIIAIVGSLILLGPIAVVVLGFDVAIAEFMLALIVWYIFDMIRLKPKKKS